MMIPYGFHSPDTPTFEAGPRAVGRIDVVTFTSAEPMEWLTDKIHSWFEDRDEVGHVTSGCTEAGLYFMTLEWYECHVDPLFLSILKHEESIDDVIVYTREED